MQPTSDLSPNPVPLAFLAGQGEMGRRTREFDWSQTSLGPAESWPHSLRTAVRIMLDSRYAMWLGWGPDLVFFYNDAYGKMTLGPKHPWALGRPTREVWAEIWDDIGPRTETVVATGQATWDEGLMLYLERNGFPEETYHTFSYSPLPDDNGGVGGMLCVVTEDTERTIGERRLRTLRELAARTTIGARTAGEACQTAASCLAENSQDLPFTLLYLLDGDGQQATLEGWTGLQPESPASPSVITLDDPDAPWPFHQVIETGQSVDVPDLADRFRLLPGGAWPSSTQQAVVLPLTRPGQTQRAGFLVAGISPHRPFDDDYRGFLDLLVGQLAAAIASARAYEEERRRAEVLAELDRAKTAFFSNVSHEFRTPLTLMLGPVEDLLSDRPDDLLPEVKEKLEVVNRNGYRLLRLVNSLLDFSRIEAGRTRATFRSTDLAAFTADLASVFRAATERAGLGLTVDCPALGVPVFVDQEMWEKVVLNLLSNAFKFTLEGGITIGLRQTGNSVEFSVADTGTGIPAEEMPRIFERFHRVENAQGRTHEGSGIGLALVQELVRLHGGSISAESTLGLGTTFRISIPLGSAHLPADQIGVGPEDVQAGNRVVPFVDEALRWLPEVQAGESGPFSTPTIAEGSDTNGSALAGPPATPVDRPSVLVVDDNADMRDYVARLLVGSYEIRTAPDGEAALASARTVLPELILTDVMMPRLDGFGLLRALREDPDTASVPVIMLSARAGEESRVEGMEAGADDYLVKPFGARELLARVAAHIQMARMRRESNASLREGEERLRMALSAARMVAWQWDPADGSLRVSENATDLFGLPDRSTLEDINQGVSLIHPDDQSAYQQTFEKAIAERGSYLIEYRLIRPVDGTTLWMEERGHAVGDDSTGGLRLVGVVMDITSRKQFEEGLRDARSRLESTLSAAEVGTWEFDVVHNVVRADRNLARLFGLTPEEANNGPLHKFTEAIHLDDRARVIEAIGQALRHNANYETEYRLVSPTGEIRWVVARGRVDRDEGGRGVRMPGVVVDITGQKQAEERQRALAEEASAANARFRAFFEQSVLFAAIVSVDGTLIEPNRLALESCSVTRDQVVGKPFWECPWWNVSAEVSQQIQEACALVATGATFRAEMPYFVRDGEERISSVTILPLTDETGRVLFLAPTGMDITDRKQAEQRLQESEERLQFALKAGRMGAWQLDLQSRYLSCSDTCKGNYGLSPIQPLTYDSLASLIVDEDRDFWNEAVQEAMSGTAGLDLEYRVRWPDGSIHWVCVRASCVVDEAGRTTAMTGVSFNIDDRKQAEEALIDADRRKDEFLATLAHELRNPLAPIRNSLMIMRISGDDVASVVEARQLMERQVAHMVRLIDDLLDVSRITQGKMELRKEQADLVAIVRNAIEASRPTIEASFHRLEIDAPAEPIPLDADATRLTQIFSNLLNNAAKYTDPGGTITLSVQSEADHAVVIVRDTGVGIPPAMLSKVFEMFTQVDRTLERSKGGLGIGLTLVKTFVEMHGGTVEARSGGPGLGSEFAVRLPTVASQTALPAVTGPSQAGAVSTGKRRILVVDDNRDAARTLARVLRLLGHQTHTAHDGQEAVDVAEQYRPDLMFLDIGLPIRNGYDVAREIRARPWGANPVILALTGWGQDADRVRSREAGIDHHIVKPVDPDLLESLAESIRSLDTTDPVQATP